MKRTIGVYSIVFFILVLAIGSVIVTYIKYGIIQDAVWPFVIILLAMALFLFKVVRISDSFVTFFSFLNIFRIDPRVDISEISKVTIYKRYIDGWSHIQIEKINGEKLRVEVMWKNIDINRLKRCLAEKQIEVVIL